MAQLSQYFDTGSNMLLSVLFVQKNQRNNNMLKEYAVALVLSTSAPVVADKQEGAKPASDSQQETVTELQTTRPKTGIGSVGGYGRP